MAGDNFFRVDADYTQLPWYRKRWFVVLTLLLFAPATVLIAATGDLYALRSDGVYLYGPAAKKGLIFVACALIFTGLLHALQ